LFFEGEIRSVGGSIFDLRTPRTLEDVMPHTPEGGYDSNFCVNQTTPPSCVLVARVVHPGSGRVLEVHSDQPGVQLYTSNNLPAEDILKGKGGATYAKHAAFCLETQNYPDAVNQVYFILH
jgi:aldose 1-epimerase